MPPRGGRTPKREHIRRRKEFLRLLLEGVDPLTASRESGHPPEKALETISELTGGWRSLVEGFKEAA